MSRKTFILAAVDREDSGPDICGTASQTLSVVIGDAFGGSSPLTFSGDWLVANNCDVNSNTVLMADGNGGTADWAYDVLDRNTIMTFHDSSTRTNVFNAASDVTGYTDENGSVFTNTPDVLGRITAVAVAPAAGVAGNAALPATPGTLAQTFQFDGLSRPTFGRDSVGTVGVGYLVNADIGFTRDSIDRVLEEQQTYVSDTRYITHNAWTSYAGTGFTFPSGRQIDKSFDALYRKNAINEASDGSSIAAWQFFGQRIATVALGNDIVTSFMNNAQTRSAIQLGQTTPAWGSISTDQLGYDGSARPIGKRHSLSGSVIVGFTSAYDPSSNKLFERALHAESRSSLYSTDSMDRLLQYLRGTLATGGGSITTPIALPNTNASQSYALDGLGNWRNTGITPEGGASQLQVRTHNKLNQLLAFGVASASTPVLYDHGNNTGTNASRGNGNIINDGTRACVFDALNRLRRVNRVSDGAPVALYVYDALHRRIDRAVFAAVSGTVPASESRYLLDGQQIVEELIGATGSPRIQYVWGQYIDELIQLKALANIGPQPLAAGNYYLLSDLLYRSAALTNNAGGIVETYDTSAYGDTLLFSAGGGTGGAWFSNGDTQAAYSACRYVFTGREYDAETGLYFYRARNFAPALGRFLNRDLIRFASQPGLYQFVTGSPARFLDPAGLAETMADYYGSWLKQHSLEDSDELSKVARVGCAGVTCLNLGIPLDPGFKGAGQPQPNMPVDFCFTSLPKAQTAIDEMKANNYCEKTKCKSMTGDVGEPRIFSMHLHSYGADRFPIEGDRRNMKHFSLATEQNVADRRRENKQIVPGGNFDVALYEPGKTPEDDRWVGADPGGDLTQSHIERRTTKDWESTTNYDIKVYCVACVNWQFKSMPTTRPSGAGGNATSRPTSRPSG